MECNKDEAVRAKGIAVSKMMNNDFEGARKIALKAKKLYPELDNISQLLAVCDVHCSAQRKINGSEMDLYGILQVEILSDEATIRKQYRKLALLLHPDKNKFHGAEAAFKLIGEANMVLSDKGKRILHDFKRRDPAKPTISKPQNPQKPQNSQGNQCSQFGAQSNNVQQQSQSGSNGKPSFWTHCPFCMIKYEYYRDVVNKKIKCPKCAKLFTAFDIGVHQSAQPPHPGHSGKQNVNSGSTRQQEEVGKQGNAKVDSQRAQPSVSPSANQPPKCTRMGDGKVSGSSMGKMSENDNVKSKYEKEGIASKETCGNHSVASDSNGKDIESQKRPLMRSQVSDSDGAVNDFIPAKKRRLRKSSSYVKDKQNDKVCDTSELNKDQGEGSMPYVKIREKDKLKEVDVKFDSVSEDDSEPVYVDVPDLEFSNFDQDKEEHCFAADQIWAIYDTLDSMPRFYAYIKKVYTSEFKLGITWLEADPENKLEKKWVEGGLPVACGRFKRGDSEVTKDRLMFSHKITYEKGSKRFSFVVYPKKGEIWALFRDWDIKWSFESENPMKFKFEIVEIISDYDKENGGVVAFMVKVEGFVSLFQKTSRARLAEHRIPSSELFRFSHRIPSLKLTGNERADVPVGSYELDTASLPDDLDNYYFSNTLKAKPEKVSEQTSHQSPEEKVKKNDFDKKEMLNIRRSPRGLKGNMVGVENTCNDVSNGFTKRPEPSSSSSSKDAIIVHDFNMDKKNWKFEEGQIWALNLKCYAQIKKIVTSPERLHVEILELCSDAIRPNVCGLYRASKVGSKIFLRDCFLYHVKAEVNGKNRFNIYPREKEIWVLYKKKESKSTYSDVKAGDCEFVEVVENNGDNIKVSSLSRVAGYLSVFRANERAVPIAIRESDRFFYRVPAFHLTEEQDGQLRGYWELDLAEFPGLLPI